MTTIVGIYRRENAHHVQRLLEPARVEGWRAAWWALDGAHPVIGDVTVGEGPGLKLPLLNETLRLAGTSNPWTVLADDDLRFRKKNVVGFVRMSERAGLDLSQPARGAGTQRSHEITVEARWSRVRRTTFVESGPLVAIGPRCRDSVLPLPEFRGMGWGVEIDWHELLTTGCRLGIVDATPIEHVGRWAEDYDRAEMHDALVEELEAHGHPMWAGMRNTLEIWRPWQRRAPWM